MRRLAEPVCLCQHKPAGAELLTDFEYLGRAPGGDDEIIIAAWERGYTRSTVYRLNARAGVKN